MISFYHMDLHHLRSVLAVADQLHFGRAARLRHLTQPALSKQIRQLEDEIGGPLFIRGRSGVVLTALGRAFVEDARFLVRSADQTLIRSQRAARGEVGTLRIAFGIATADLVARAIARFRKLRADVQIELEDMSTTGQIEALRAGLLDFGFIRLPAPDDLASRLVVRERLVVAVPRERARTITWQDEPFILLPRAVSPSFHDHILRVCAELGVQPRAVQQARELATVLAFVAAGVGVSLVPASAVAGRGARIRALPLPSKLAVWSIGAVWRRDYADPTLAVFRDVVDAERRLARSG
jgi:DNA-binding transcriptional LysR family regulator